MDRKGNHWIWNLMLGIWILPFIYTCSPPQIIFERTYGGTDRDGGRSVQQTSEGGYIILGSTDSFSEGFFSDVYLIKTDSLGDTLWTRNYGGPSSEKGYSVQQTSDGGYMVAGWTSSFGEGGADVYLIKSDSLGNILWTRTYGGINADLGLSIQHTSDGGYVIAGYTTSFGAGLRDVYLIRTDSLGDTLWTRTYGGTDHDWAYSVHQTLDAGYIITGTTNSFGAGNGDSYVIKTDSLGDTIWTRTYGGSSNNDIGCSVRQTSDGGYIIAGITTSFGAGSADVYLIKTDSSGESLWTKTYGDTSAEWGYSVQQISDGGYIITGMTDSFGAGSRDIYLIRTDSLGDTLWTRTYGGAKNDVGYTVQQTQEGGYIITGETYSFGAGGTDVYLIKTDENGQVLK